MIIRGAEIERRIGKAVDVERIAPRTDERRLRTIGVRRAAAAAVAVRLDLLE